MNKKRIFKGIGFTTKLDTRENFEPFIVYDGILTTKGNYKVDNTNLYNFHDLDLTNKNYENSDKHCTD